jgi:SHS2 domain-containing protein
MSDGGEFRFVEGATSDLAFVASGRSLEEVFSAAAEALLAATVERPAAVEARTAHVVRLSDRALDLLLLKFLNELIYLRDADGLLLRPRWIAIRVAGAAALEAELAGETLDPARHERAGEVKAATLHGLELTDTGAGWTASVTLDV